MSGGSLNYLYRIIGESIDLPYGHYSEIDNDDCCKEARNNNPFYDEDVSELAYDFSCVAHALEWYESGDICDDTYFRCLNKFKDKWIAKERS